MADSFGDTVPFIIDGGPCEIGLESTILDLSRPDTPVILRPGAVSREQIAQVLNRPVSIRHEVVKESEAASAPGTMARHYSPSSPLHLFEHPAPQASGNAAIVFLKRPRNLSAESGNCFWFSETGDPAEIGRSLFSLLRTLDAKGFAAIHCQ
ncbi:MAG: Sua5 family C-terminal domain-containing protein, partial [Longimicrobiales bacterium]